MGNILERYVKSIAEGVDKTAETNAKSLDNIDTQIQKLRSMQGNAVFDGNDIAKLSLKEITQLEHQMQESLVRVRAKKDELILEKLEEMKEMIKDGMKAANCTKSGVIQLKEQNCGEQTCTPSEVPPGSGSSLSIVMIENGQTDHITAQLRVDSGSNTTKRARLSEDLNLSPDQCMDAD